MAMTAILENGADIQASNLHNAALMFADIEKLLVKYGVCSAQMDLYSKDGEFIQTIGEVCGIVAER